MNLRVIGPNQILTCFDERCVICFTRCTAVCLPQIILLVLLFGFLATPPWKTQVTRFYVKVRARSFWFRLEFLTKC